MSVDISYREGLVIRAKEILRAGGKLPGFEGDPDAASTDDHAFAELARAVARSSYSKEEPPNKAIARTGTSGASSRIEIPLSIATSIAIRRAQGEGNDGISIRSIQDERDVLARVFVNVQHARNANGRGSYSDSTVEDQVWGILADRIFAHWSAGISVMPPLPLKYDFAQLFQSRFGIDAEQFRMWKKLPIWPDVISRIYQRMMGTGFLKEPKGEPLARRRSEIDLRNAWYYGILAMGADQQSVTALFRNMAESNPTDSNIRALAWLSLTIPEIEFTQESANRRAEILAKEMDILHRMGPKLGAAEFLGLLPPLAQPMDEASIIELLRGHRGKEHDFEIFRARAILAWHSESHEHAVNFFAKLIRNNKRYDSLEKFCEHMLAADIKALQDWLYDMAKSRMSVQPILNAIDRKFPKHSIIDPYTGKRAVAVAAEDRESVDAKADERQMPSVPPHAAELGAASPPQFTLQPPTEESLEIPDEERVGYSDPSAAIEEGAAGFVAGQMPLPLVFKAGL